MQYEFNVPVGTRKLRPRDLRRIADRPVDQTHAHAWAIVSMVDLTVKLVGHEGEASSALIAEAASVLVSAPTEIIARALISLMSSEPTFTLSSFVEYVEHETMRAEPPKRAASTSTKVPDEEGKADVEVNGPTANQDNQDDDADTDEPAAPGDAQDADNEANAEPQAIGPGVGDTVEMTRRPLAQARRRGRKAA